MGSTREDAFKEIETLEISRVLMILPCGENELQRLRQIRDELLANASHRNLLSQLDKEICQWFVNGYSEAMFAIIICKHAGIHGSARTQLEITCLDKTLADEG